MLRAPVCGLPCLPARANRPIPCRNRCRRRRRGRKVLPGWQWPNGPGWSTGAACVWADHDTFGFFLAPALRTSSLANTLLTFRSAIEMPSH